MCIIVVKDKKVNLPKEEYLKNCFDNNPDGAGFMYTNRGSVVIDKGYMTYNSFLKHYKKLCKKFDNFKDKSLVMHFRIGTAGANNKENTHPYPITNDLKLLHKTYVKTNLGVVHNGIISQYNPEIKKDNINDTQNFIMKYLYPVYSNWGDFYMNKNFLEGLENITNSKLAFLDNCDTIKLVGKFETDEDGVKYSNSNYLPYYGYNYGYNSNDKYINDYLYDVQLEPQWFYAIKDGELTRVGDRILIFDYYDGCLYEIRESGNYINLGEDVEIYDENGEEIIL